MPWTGSVKSVGLDHIVLLVAAQAVLRTERGGQVEAGGGERVEAVGQVAGHRRRMREQRDALAFERLAQFRVGEQPVDSEQSCAAAYGSCATKQSGCGNRACRRRMGERPVGLRPVVSPRGPRTGPDATSSSAVDGDGRADGPPGEIVLHPDVGRRADLGPGPCLRGSPRNHKPPNCPTARNSTRDRRLRPRREERPRSRSSATTRPRATVPTARE